MLSKFTCPAYISEHFSEYGCQSGSGQVRPGSSPSYGGYTQYKVLHQTHRAAGKGTALCREEGAGCLETTPTPR